VSHLPASSVYNPALTAAAGFQSVVFPLACSSPVRVMFARFSACCIHLLQKGLQDAASRIYRSSERTERLSTVWYLEHDPYVVQVSLTLPSNIVLYCIVFLLLPFLLEHRASVDRLCGPVVRVAGYRSRGPVFDSRPYQISDK
jgi:hypothetical protein